MYIDTHAHLTDAAFDGDRRELIARLAESGVGKIIEISCDPRDFAASSELAEKNPGIYLAFGIHPEFAESYTESDIAALEKYLKHEKCVALGEIGLDYHWKPYDREKQLELFRRQLDMAVERDMPVSMHIREAYGDCMEVLEGYNGRLRGVMHCFSGSAETAERCVGLGLYIAFGGALTFKSNKKGPAACAATPLDRLLTETDCPYMAPEPRRGERNDPGSVPVICRKMAEIKGISPEEMERAAEENAERLFGL